MLTGGRLRLGIGIGWNYVEYEALGEDFHTRGRRAAEQIRLLRALWTKEVIDFQGRYHKVSHAGINPLPVRRPIPIWLGGGHDRVLRRIGRLGDGWFPQFQPDSAGQERIAQMREHARAAGRDPMSIGIEGRISIASGTPDDWSKTAAAWEEVGATTYRSTPCGQGSTAQTSTSTPSAASRKRSRAKANRLVCTAGRGLERRLAVNRRGEACLAPTYPRLDPRCSLRLCGQSGRRLVAKQVSHPVQDSLAHLILG